MIGLKTFVWALSIFACTLSESTADQKEGFSFIAKNAFNDGNLLYAKCIKITPNTTECDIVQEFYPDKKNARLCAINVDGDSSRLNSSIGIFAVDKDKAVLYWESEQNNIKTIKISTVCLETCKIYEIKIPDAGKEALAGLFSANTIVPYEDSSFDIFFNNPERCGEKLCRLQIDSEGKAEPNTLNIGDGLVNYISPIASRSSSKGFAYLKKNDAELSLMISKTDGSEKQLTKYTNDERPVVSASNNVVTACSKPNADSDVTCTQYDENGNTKFTATIVDANKNVRPTSVYNPPDGGTLVMIAEFDKCDQQEGCTNGNNYRVMVIATDGDIIGILYLKAFDDVKSRIKKTYIYKNADDKYCAAILGLDSIGHVHTVKTIELQS